MAAADATPATRSCSRPRAAHTPGARDPLLLTGVVFGKLGARPEAGRFYAKCALAGVHRARACGATST